MLGIKDLFANYRVSVMSRREKVPRGKIPDSQKVDTCKAVSVTYPKSIKFQAY